MGEIKKMRRDTCVSKVCGYRGCCDVTEDEYCPMYEEKEN